MVNKRTTANAMLPRALYHFRLQLVEQSIICYRGKCSKEKTFSAFKNIFKFLTNACHDITHLDGSSLSDDISDDVRLSSIVEFVFLAEMAKEGERFSIGPTRFHSAVTL